MMVRYYVNSKDLHVELRVRVLFLSRPLFVRNGMFQKQHLFPFYFNCKTLVYKYQEEHFV